jgi:predicted nucleic acid-binding protein
VSFVLDASAALAWCFPDEHNDYAWAVLARVRDERAYVPTTWWLEMAQGLALAERRARIAAPDVSLLCAMLGELPIDTDRATADRALSDTLHLSRRLGVSAYDASYVELALRRRLPLATLDTSMIAAARAVMLEIVS